MTRQILLVGCGGREDALARKLADSMQVSKVFVAPGNGGTQSGDGRIENVPIDVMDSGRLISFAVDNDIHLTVIGPEAPLVAGVVDSFDEAGLRCFGPVAAAARIEGSKSFSKQLMEQLGIPTARHAVFDDYADAVAYVRGSTDPVVVKASGLAGGKGVVVPHSKAEAEQALRRIMVDRDFGDAGSTVIIEQRLLGREASILAFSDGTTLVPMPPARNHKALLDGNEGPNTGGMGAYAPAPLVDDALLEYVVTEVMRPAIRALAVAGDPYVGVLGAGMMITDDGPEVLEFNCRFGDPETQVVVPLLETDLLDILNACVDGELDKIDIRWRGGVAATVVVAAEGYPSDYTTGREIYGIAEADSVPGVTVFHAGTSVTESGRVLASSGRVLAVTGVQPDLPMALACAYHGIEHITLEGMQYRTDIGAHPSIDGPETSGPRGTTYADAGVDIDAGVHAVDLMKNAVESTYGPEVLAGLGAVGGMYDASALGPNAVLVASTDGVGTKTKIATALNRYDTIGCDIVNHCINDVVVQGATPLFFLDYVGTDNLDPAVVAEIVGGMAAACRDARCALLGGDTAELPGVYQEGELELVGTMVGVVRRDEIIDGSRIMAGDVVIGIRSSGLHTNGFALARNVFQHWDLNDRVAALGTTLGDALLAPHRSYLREVDRLRTAEIDIHSLVHVTGGGLIDNPAKVMPPGLAMEIRRDSWATPALFTLIRSQGNIDEPEMYRTFNMGLGLLVVVPETQSRSAIEAIGTDAYVVGRIQPRGESAVVLT